jgi:MBOAT family protein
MFDNPALHTGVENLMAVYGYAMVIYCDFSGYSEIAIGIALWLGFKIPPNFMSPYQSLNITEFWRRWHISLSTWLKDYLYIPLGGNRNFSVASFIFVGGFLVGSFIMGVELFHLSNLWAAVVSAVLLLIFIIPALITRKTSGIAANFNLLTTMLLGGFWHGASWNFIIWGAIHGVGLGIHKIWMLLTDKSFSGFNQSRIYKIISGILTFHFVCFAWIFFKAEDLEIAKTMIYQIFNNFDISVFGPFYDNYKGVVWMILAAMLLHLIPDNLADKVIARTKTIPMVVYILVFFLFLILYGYFKSAEQVMPIYLQF